MEEVQKNDLSLKITFTWFFPSSGQETNTGPGHSQTYHASEPHPKLFARTEILPTVGQQVDYSNGDSSEGSSKPLDPRAPPESFRPPLPWNPAGFQYQNSCLNHTQPALKTVCPSK